MAVESQRYSRRVVGHGPAGRRRSLTEIWRQTGAISREATPWLAAAIVVTFPFIVYGVGQARLTAAMRRQAVLLKGIESDRVEITRERTRLRRILAPDVLASWADRNGMNATNDVVQLGLQRTASVP